MRIEDQITWLSDAPESRLLVVLEPLWHRIRNGEYGSLPMSIKKNITTPANLHAYMYDNLIEEVVLYDARNMLLSLLGMLYHGQAGYTERNKHQCNNWRDRVEVIIVGGDR